MSPSITRAVTAEAVLQCWVLGCGQAHLCPGKMVLEALEQGASALYLQWLVTLWEIVGVLLFVIMTTEAPSQGTLDWKCVFLMLLVYLGIWFGLKALMFETPDRVYPDGILLDTTPLWWSWQWIYWHKTVCTMDSDGRCNKISWHHTNPLLRWDGYVKMSALWHKNYCQLITEDHAAALCIQILMAQ